MPSEPPPVPSDDLSRKLTVARPDHDQSLPHIGLAGDTYTILVAGQEEFFTLVGQPVATRTQAPPPLDAAARAAFVAKSKALTPEYRTELLPPPGAK